MGWRDLFKKKKKPPFRQLKDDIYFGALFLTGGASFLSLKFYILFESLFHMGGTRLLTYNFVVAGFGFSDWFAILGAFLMGSGAYIIIHGLRKFEKKGRMAWSYVV